MNALRDDPEVMWGVRMPGGRVGLATDWRHAFRLERLLRPTEGDVVACFSVDEGRSWVVVEPTSPMRPDPAPPRRPTSTGSRGPGWLWGATRACRALYGKLRGLNGPTQGEFRRNGRG